MPTDRNWECLRRALSRVSGVTLPGAMEFLGGPESSKFHWQILGLCYEHMTGV
ncbi:MAG: hypothetical protein ACI8PT_003041 [Gammaproteobacteria bacterium]|jgi:hypothetical protein